MLSGAFAQTFLLSLLPGVFWLTYLRSLSGGRIPSWWKWALAVLAGWASARLTLLVSEVAGVSELQSIPHFGSLLYFVFGVGLVEEACKAFCALVSLKVPRLMEQPLTALQLSCGVCLGFATTENLQYAMIFGDSVLLGRFVFSTLGHVLFGSLWGFALGARRTSQGTKTAWGSFFGFLLLSALSHGLYDWFLMTQRPMLAMITLVVLWMGFREATLEGFLHQEYQRELPYQTARCSHCAVLTRADGEYCCFCGGHRGDDEVIEPELPQPVEHPTAPSES